MTVRDSLLPAFQRARQILEDLGFRRYAVQLRRRTWSGAVPGDGTSTVVDVEISPRPRVREVTTKEIADSGGTWRSGDYKLDKITPRYTAPIDGGYAPSDIVLRPAAPNEDVAIILTGDEGSFECELVEAHFERKFAYWLIARRTDVNR